MPMLGHRRATVVVAAAASVLLTGVGFGASLLIKSPAQAVAETRPPAPDVLTVPVEHRVLSATVVTRGQVTAGQLVDVMAAAGGSAIVTKLPVQAGAEVKVGASVLEVSGRPLFALRGDLPAYRDLKPGATGMDVAQLQKALKELGFGVNGDVAGVFAEGTKTAVTAFYASRGYDPVPSNPDGAQQVADAEDSLTAAQRNLDDANEALASAQASAVRPSEVQPPSNGPIQDASPSTQVAPSSPSALHQATPSPQQQSAVADARKRVDRANEDLSKVRAKLLRIRAENGPMVPSAETVYLSDFPARVSGISSRVGGVPAGKAMTLSTGSLVVEGRLSPGDKGLVHPGQQVEVLSELTGTKVSAKVGAVASAVDSSQSTTADGPGQGQASVAQTGYRLTIQPDTPLDPAWTGQDVRVTIVAASSDGPVLVVPVSAISATSDGRTVVTVYADGQRRRVEVVPGTVGSGSAEVRPLTPDTLREGDQVIVGTKEIQAAGPVK
ncbi:peptidoglycan-binding protein [Kitasatospora cineracea]|uniref:peptidoglycan-binding protein n=1 Tax=Kitasatospora cineracea TaxID=88074 RepID=UPI0034121744